MDAIQKLKITNRARSLNLWKPAGEFKERQRCVLRKLGLSKQEAIQEAWLRTDRMLDEMSEQIANPFKPKAIPWDSSFTGCDAMEPGVFDADSGWAFVFFLDSNASPPSEFAESFARFGRTQIRWFLLAGAEYFYSAPIEQLVLV
jgi:hypothetical protein